MSPFHGPRFVLPVVGAAALILLSATPALGQSNGKAKKGRGDGAEVQVSLEVVFTSVERTHIVEFFTGRPPEGVQALPPGIRKNLARGKPLPPGIAKKMLPPDLERALPVRDGYQRVVVGLDVLLVEVATGIVHDVLMDVIR